MIVTTFFNGLFVSLGYTTLMEKMPEFSILFLVMMFSHIVITSYIIAHGFLYRELKSLIENELDDLINTIVEQRRTPKEEGGTLYKQYKGEL